jgi:hypothetical protein
VTLELNVKESRLKTLDGADSTLGEDVVETVRKSLRGVLLRAGWLAENMASPATTSCPPMLLPPTAIS